MYNTKIAKSPKIQDPKKRGLAVRIDSDPPSRIWPPTESASVPTVAYSYTLLRRPHHKNYNKGGQPWRVETSETGTG